MPDLLPFAIAGGALFAFIAVTINERRQAKLRRQAREHVAWWRAERRPWL